MNHSSKKIILCIYAVYILSLLMDVITTVYGFMMGHTETNPLVYYSMGFFGYGDICPPLTIQIKSLIIVILFELLIVTCTYYFFAKTVIKKQVSANSWYDLRLLWILPLIIWFLGHMHGVLNNLDSLKSMGMCLKA